MEEDRRAGETREVMRRRGRCSASIFSRRMEEEKRPGGPKNPFVVRAPGPHEGTSAFPLFFHASVFENSC